MLPCSDSTRRYLPAIDSTIYEGSILATNQSVLNESDRNIDSVIQYKHSSISPMKRHNTNYTSYCKENNNSMSQFTSKKLRPKDHVNVKSTLTTFRDNSQ